VCWCRSHQRRAAATLCTLFFRIPQFSGLPTGAIHHGLACWRQGARTRTACCRFIAPDSLSSL